MWERTAVVDKVCLSVLTYTALFNIGNLKYYSATNNVLAYQREEELFFGNEGRYGAYKVFHRLPTFPPIDETIHMTVDNRNPYISVDCIHSQAVSIASLFHIGNGKQITNESRVMNVRQLRENRTKGGT